MRHLLVIGLLLLATQSGGQNLIPNSGFEEHKARPLSWFNTGEHFTRVIRDWYAPTVTSPDAYGPRVRIPKFWQQKGFGAESPKTGSGMAGITLFGCVDGKPHCREYLAVPLKEPLQIGKRYQLSFYVQRLERSLAINNLGAALSSTAVLTENEERLNLTPILKQQKILSSDPGVWEKLEVTFAAKENSKYLIIGNFHEDNKTQTEVREGSIENYAYYYIDDVVLLPLEVKPANTTKPVVVKKKTDWPPKEIFVGSVIRLNNIYFDHDKSELLPKSFLELNKVLSFLKENPQIEIEVRGHTDNVGAFEYNIDLSKRRAAAVFKYLTDKGIKRTRLKFHGFGNTEPIASNNTNDGRQLNRRVEIKIIKM